MFQREGELQSSRTSEKRAKRDISQSKGIRIGSIREKNTLKLYTCAAVSSNCYFPTCLHPGISFHSFLADSSIT